MAEKEEKTWTRTEVDQIVSRAIEPYKAAVRCSLLGIFSLAMVCLVSIIF